MEYTYNSGKNEGDIIEFILFRMYNWDMYNGSTKGTLGDIRTSPQKKAPTGSPKNDALIEMDMNDDPLFGISDDESVGDHPPTNYLPIGFFFFLSRGTLADADHQINILNLGDFSDGIKNTKGSKKGEGVQKAHQETAKEDKSAKYDYQLGTDTEYRGVALGTDSQKGVAAIALQQ